MHLSAANGSSSEKSSPGLASGCQLTLSPGSTLQKCLGTGAHDRSSLPGLGETPLGGHPVSPREGCTVHTHSPSAGPATTEGSPPFTPARQPARVGAGTSQRPSASPSQGRSALLAVLDSELLQPLIFGCRWRRPAPSCRAEPGNIYRLKGIR